MITITNNNIYFSDAPLYELSSLEHAEIIHESDIANYLADPVQLGESVTFKRLFDIVTFNIDKFNVIFCSSLSGFPLEPYLQEIENNPTEVYESDYLEIHWYCDRYEDELNISPSIHGISNKNSEYYAMDFLSLNNLKNYNVRLNESVEIFDYNKPKEETNTYLGDMDFTVFNLYDAILSEISYHGGPQDKKERFHELVESFEETNIDQIDEESAFVSFEDMIEEFDAKDEYLVKYGEFRDRIDKDRLSNLKNLPKLKNCLLEKLKIYDIIENSDENLDQYYKKLTDIEYNMQMLYGEEEDIIFHRFWETPKCTCPKIDNVEIYPCKEPIFDKECPIHKKTS